MMQPPTPPPPALHIFSVHTTTPCLCPFLPAIQYRMGGGYELSNPKGNVPHRQLPSEKWPFLGHKCVCVCVQMCVYGLGGEFDMDQLRPVLLRKFNIFRIIFL